MSQAISLSVLDSLPPENRELTPILFRERHQTVILDDDPTGTQTVHGITVLTDASVALLTEQFQTPDRAFFILTNSRALPTGQASALITRICRNLRAAAGATGHTFTVILRGDSTLRGHFPAEPEAVEMALDAPFDKWLICPFFEEGGRFTVQGIHYVREGERLIPVADTPFAHDVSFGYRHSDLREWVEEKTGGAVRAREIGLLSIGNIRQLSVLELANQLAQPIRIWVTNAVSLRDVEIVSAACRRLETRGIRILYRTGASFVQAYLGLQKRPPLSLNELIDDRLTGQAAPGGLVVIGSYVPKTTAQFAKLAQTPELEKVELNVERLLADAPHDAEISDATRRVNASLRAGQTAVLFTSRRLITGNDPATNLQIGQRVSDALVAVVEGLTVRPRFFIAKGGITSSDVATKGLNVRKATILGQALPGVPVWQLGDESRFPGLAYIVFPGNVGSDTALAELIQTLSRGK